MGTGGVESIGVIAHRVAARLHPEKTSLFFDPSLPTWNCANKHPKQFGISHGKACKCGAKESSKK